jgi:NMD protein affecting ribosome stability and mRNA decay
MHGRESRRCDECGSDYFADASRMASLCPECAHHLYGYPACPHAFADRRCLKCGWDGTRSAYIERIIRGSAG